MSAVPRLARNEVMIMTTTTILLCHVGAAIVIYLGFLLDSLRGGALALKPRATPVEGPIGLVGVVTGSEPPLVGPCSQRECVAWRISWKDAEGDWRYGPIDLADAITLRLDDGGEVRLVFPDPTLPTGQECEGKIPKDLDLTKRPPRVGQLGPRLRDLVREESIAVGDRVYISGTFSLDSTSQDDPMRREGELGAASTWTVRRPARKKPVLLHQGVAADFRLFGPRSAAHFYRALKLTIPSLALYFALAVFIFGGRLW